MKNDRIAVALLGAGRIGQEHAKNLAALPQVEVVVVCDPRIESAEAVRPLVRAKDVTPSPEEAVNRKDVDAVIICTPTDTHAALIEAAAETGKAVEAGFAALDAYNKQLRAKGREILEWCARNDRPCILILARPYHMDPGIGHEIDADLQARG